MLQSMLKRGWWGQKKQQDKVFDGQYELSLSVLVYVHLIQ